MMFQLPKPWLRSFCNLRGKKDDDKDKDKDKDKKDDKDDEKNKVNRTKKDLILNTARTCK